MVVGIFFAQYVFSANPCHNRVLICLELLYEERSDTVGWYFTVFYEVIPMLILVFKTDLYFFWFCHHPESVVMRVIRVFKGTKLDIT